MNIMPKFLDAMPATTAPAADPAITPDRVAAAFAGWTARPVRRDWTIPSVRAWHDTATR